MESLRNNTRPPQDRQSATLDEISGEPLETHLLDTVKMSTQKCGVSGIVTEPSGA
jgi:hypothetical protein